MSPLPQRPQPSPPSRSTRGLAEVHVHTFGDVTWYDFLAHLTPSRCAEIDWRYYEGGFAKAYGYPSGLGEILQRHHAGDPDAGQEFRKLFVFGDPDAGNFARFQAKFNLLICGSVFLRMHTLADPVKALCQEQGNFLSALPEPIRIRQTAPIALAPAPNSQLSSTVPPPFPSKAHPRPDHPTSPTPRTRQTNATPQAASLRSARTRQTRAPLPQPTKTAQTVTEPPRTAGVIAAKRAYPCPGANNLVQTATLERFSSDAALPRTGPIFPACVA